MAKMKIGLQQRLQQRMSPQQIQVVRLLELPVQQFEQRIKRELEENPTLEEGPSAESDTGYDSTEEYDDAAETATESSGDDEFTLEDYLDDDDEFAQVPYSGRSSDYDPDSPREEMPYAVARTFREQLLEQLGYRRIAPDTRRLAEYIVGNLDADGYLRRDLQSLADDLLLMHGETVDVKQFEKALEVVQSLEPKGIGARSLEECLLLQLEGVADAAADHARQIVLRYFDLFTRKHYEKIQAEMGLDNAALREAIEAIMRLNPRPADLGEDQHDGHGQAIVPDFILQVDENSGELTLALHGENMPELRVNKGYADMLRRYASQGKGANPEEQEAMQFVRQKIDSARWFIRAVRQRNSTMMHVMEAIAAQQRDFFLEGDPALIRPLILKDVADAAGVDISTVSRVVNSKYVQTPFGIRLLRDFFSDAIENSSGETISTREVKTALASIVEAEDKQDPLTDDRLVEELARRGYKLARRTVAKYREQLRIPIARMRREVH